MTERLLCLVFVSPPGTPPPLPGAAIQKNAVVMAAKIATAVQTSAYTATILDLVLCDPSIAPFPVTLPDFTGWDGWECDVKNMTNSTAAITVGTTTPSSGMAQTIDGQAT